MNGLALAYVGDAYYELKIRKHVLAKGYTNVDVLHKFAVKFTASVAQAKIMNYLLESNELTADEVALYKKGRNTKSQSRRNIDAKTYQAATGFEALIGFLSLEDEMRCEQLILKAIDYIEKAGEQNE